PCFTPAEPDAARPWAAWSWAFVGSDIIRRNDAPAFTEATVGPWSYAAGLRKIAERSNRPRFGWAELFPSPAPRERVATPGSQSGGSRVRVDAEAAALPPSPRPSPPLRAGLSHMVLFPVVIPAKQAV